MPAARDFWARRMMCPSTSFFICIIRSAISSTKMTMYGIRSGMRGRSSSSTGLTRRQISSTASSL